MKRYDAKTDAMWSNPYIDREERMKDKNCLYVHGGFAGADLRFSCFFPVK